MERQSIPTRVLNEKPYLDLQPLLAQKAAWRKAQAALPYAEKIKIVAKLSGWKIEADDEMQAPDNKK